MEIILWVVLGVGVVVAVYFITAAAEHLWHEKRARDGNERRKNQEERQRQLAEQAERQRVEQERQLAEQADRERAAREQETARQRQNALELT